MQIKNVTLSATTETEITIEQGYPYVWFKNLGDNTVYVSASPDILDNGSVKTEGVSTITSGECTSVTTKSDKVYAYALGATIVEVHAQGNPESSFKIKAKGGESSVTVEPILITHNGEYTAPEGKAYSPVNVQTPVYNITPLTLTHNHQGAEAGLYGGYSPVNVDIEMDTLKAPANGVYEIDENTDGWDTVLVDTYEKFEVVYSNSGRSVENANGLVKSLTTTNYDEFYMTAYYAYNDASAPTGNYAAMWSTRYPIDAMMHKTNVGACGSDNFMWTHANQYDPADEIRGFYSGNFIGYAYPFMYIGVKDRDAQRTTLYYDGTAAIRTDITLSDSIFNYDELILTFATGTYQSDNYATASAYPVSTIQIGKQLCGFNDATGAYFAYEVTSAAKLTLVHYQDFYLVDVQGIKNDSMEETVIFTNPSSSSVPATVTLSQTYKNFDEICLVGHTADAQFEDMIITQYYPVKALTKEFDIPANKKISLFLDAENCWLSIHDDTTFIPDSTSPAIILDKIIGINKPVISTAHELIDVEPLSVAQNGTYTAPSGTAYSLVTVDVQEQPWSPLQDGYSNFWFELTDDTLSPWLNFSAKNADATIDWGDGSGEVALDTLTPTHTYSKAGKYVVKVKGVTGIARQYDVPSNGDYLGTIKYVELNNEVTTLGNNAFMRCVNLRRIVCPAVTSVGLSAFQYCSFLNQFDMPVVATQTNGSFGYCTSLSSINLNNVETINASSFVYCVSLQSVTIPSTVTVIGNAAFSSCASLATIHVLATNPPTLGTNPFAYINSDYIIYVPVGTGETYKAASGWSAYSEHILEEGQTPNRAMMSRLAKVDNDGDIMEDEKNEADDESSDMR